METDWERGEGGMGKEKGQKKKGQRKRQKRKRQKKNDRKVNDRKVNDSEGKNRFRRKKEKINLW